jgi:hypothetical protein
LRWVTNKAALFKPSSASEKRIIISFFIILLVVNKRRTLSSIVATPDPASLAPREKGVVLSATVVVSFGI